MSFKEIFYIILIFALFAFSHSLCVTDFVKRLIVRFLGEGFVRAAYRFLFICFSILAVSAVFLLIRTIPDKTVIVFPVWIKVVFLFMQFLGLVIGVMTFRVINFFEFIGISQLVSSIRSRRVTGDIEGIKENRLIVEGMYGVVRHPLYLAGMLVFTFNSYFTRNAITVTILADLYFVIGALIEERRFKKRFGTEYDEYMKRVPMFLPRLKSLFGRRMASGDTGPA